MKSAIRSLSLFALCSAVAAASWQHYGAAARQMIAAWTPPFASIRRARQSRPDLLRGRIRQRLPCPSGRRHPRRQRRTTRPHRHRRKRNRPKMTRRTGGSSAPSPDATQLQSMARDLAAMGQEIELLKATVAELNRPRGIPNPPSRQNSANQGCSDQTRHAKSAGEGVTAAARGGGRGSAQSGATLSVGDLSGAVLSRAALSAAVLSDAVLSDASLSARAKRRTPASRIVPVGPAAHGGGYGRRAGDASTDAVALVSPASLRRPLTRFAPDDAEPVIGRAFARPVGLTMSGI